MSNRPLQAVKKKSTVRETGQAVMEGQVRQLFFGAFSFGDVAVDYDQSINFAFWVSNRTRGGLKKAPGTVLVSNTVFEPFAPAGAVSLRGSLQYTREIVRMNLIHGRSCC